MHLGLHPTSSARWGERHVERVRIHAVGEARHILLCRPIVAMNLERGQYGHHNASARHTVAYRRRLVRPRAVVLGSDFTYIDGMLAYA
jgi:hypothetical protein